MSEEEINPAELIDLRRKRRSKNENSGRIYTCEECQKGYLSQPALNNHRKTKHPDKIDPSEEKRGRGRPRKVLSNFSLDPNNSKYENYFYNESRRRIPEEQIDVGSVVEKAYNEIFIINGNRCFVHPNSASEYPIFSMILNQEIIQKRLKERTIDDIFYEFLLLVISLANEKTIFFEMKFIVLFREAINNFKRSDFQGIQPLNQDFSSFSAPEEIPQFTNYFYCEFMEENNYYGMNEYEKKDLVDAILHFCFWLFKNSYTDLKVNLIN